METKILHFSNQNDKDFINNNVILKQDFQDLYNVQDINKIFNNFKDGTISIGHK